MGARQHAEQRFFPRYLSVSKGFNGTLYNQGRVLGARVIDVSRDGLGVLLADPVAKGTTLELHFENCILQFQVVYCEKDLIHHNEHRCGLRRVGSTQNLVSLFRAHGFIDEP